MQTMRMCPECGNKSFSDSPLAKSSENQILTSSPGTTSGAVGSPPVKVDGWLLLFVITLTIITPLVVAVSIIGSVEIVRTLPDVGGIKKMVITAFCIDASLALYAIYVGVQLWHIKAGAVRAVKTFLVVNFVVAFSVGWFVFNATGDTMMLTRAIGPLIYGGIWYAYLTHSKRVKATFNL